MMNAKVTTVTLTSVIGERDFEISHAERILRMPNSGWELKDGKLYKVNRDGTISRRNKEGTKRAET